VTINHLVALLNHHWANITKDSFFAVVMQGHEDGKVHVSRLGRVSDPETPNKPSQQDASKAGAST